MLILPRSNPLYENIPVQKINLPDALKKMGAGGFTGYLGFGSASSEGYFVFIKGALISIMMLEGTQRKSGFEAITCLFEHTIAEGGVINVYRMTVDLAVCTNALLHGTILAKPEPVSGVDLKALLARMKTLALNGTVIFSAPDHSAFIFYKEGTPIGFYHDAACEIDPSPAEAQRIAALPGATVEIRSSSTAEELQRHNLLETLNIDRLWQASINRHAAAQAKVAPTTPPAVQQEPDQVSITGEIDAKLLELVDDLQEIAKAYLGRQGAELVDNILDLVGGRTALVDPQKVTAFLAALAAQSPDIDPEAKNEEMVDLMRSELAGRLSI